MTEPAGPRPAALRGPLAHLFAEERYRDHQAREALFLTYNADLGWFERTVLGVAQSTGARLAVVADARVGGEGQHGHDPRAVRNAGLRYLPGQAVLTGGAAFHPKLTLLVGPQRALAVVGSGNLTGSGWHYNAETWTVLAGTPDGAPPALRGLAAFLRGLTARDLPLVLADEVVQRLLAAADMLEEFPAATEPTGAQVLHNLDRPLLEQLPAEPASRLSLYAPFHDPHGAALRALVDRYEPQHLRLAVQTGGRTVLDVDVLRPWVAEQTAAGRRIELVEDAEERYRHGKLVELDAGDGSGWTLTGSPNLSAVALLRSTRQGGNVELAVLHPRPVGLFPLGRQMQADEVTGSQPVSAEAAEDARFDVLVVRAVTDPSGLLVELARPAPVALRVQVSVPGADAGWRDVGVLAPAERQGVLPADVPGGSRLRAVWGRAGVQSCPVVFVVDPLSVLLTVRDIVRADRAIDRTPSALVADARLLDLWIRSITEVGSAIAAVTLRTGTPGTSEQNQEHRRPALDERAWLRYEEEVREQLGGPVAEFALGGFPRLHALGTRAPLLQVVPPEDRLVDESEAALDDDDPDELAPALATEPTPAEGTSPIGGGNVPERQRARVRQKLLRLVDESAALHPVARQAALLLVIVAQQAGAYEGADRTDDWTLVLQRALQQLEHLDAQGHSDVPERLLPALAAAAATAHYLLYDAVGQRGLQTEAYAHLLVMADAEHVASFSRPLHKSNGFSIDPDDVLRVAEMAVQDDDLRLGLDEVERAEPGWQVDRCGPCAAEVRSPRGTPLVLAARVLEALPRPEASQAWACRASNEREEWVILVLERDVVWRVEGRPSQPTLWYEHRLPPLLGPLILARDPELRQRTRRPRGPLLQPLPEVVALLQRCGADHWLS
jgi:hypothetical protein